MNKKSVDETFKLALKLHRVGELTKASAIYQDILKLVLDHPDANHNLALILIEKGEFDQALILLQRCVTAPVTLHQYWLSYSELLVHQEKQNELKEVVQDAKRRKISPEVIEVLNERYEGLSNRSQSQHGVAKLSFKDHLKYLKELFDRNDLKTFVPNAQKFLINNPNNTLIWNMLGCVYRKMGNLTEARNAFQNTIALQSDFLEGHFNLAMTLKLQGELEDAVTAFEITLSHNSNHLEALLNLGKVLRSLGRLEDAVRVFKKFVILMPDHSKKSFGLGNLANTLRDLGRFDEAIEIYNKALLIAGTNRGELLNNLGTAFLKKDDFQEALVNFDKALQVDPNLSAAYINKSIISKQRGLPEKAKLELLKSIDLSPIEEAAYNHLGLILYEEGNFDEAIAVFSKGISIAPDSYALHLNISLAHYKYGRLKEAVEAIQEAITLNPNSSAAYANFGVMLKEIKFEKRHRKTEEILILMLDKNNVVRPVDIAPAAISLLKLDQNIIDVLDAQANDNFHSIMLEFLPKLCKNKLLLKLIAICPIPNLEFEALLKEFRSFFLYSIYDEIDLSSFVEFQSALALHCFMNEYLYGHSVREAEILKELEHRVSTEVQKGKQPNSAAILCLASYSSLENYSFSTLLECNSRIQKVYNVQVLEPQKEKVLIPTIPSIGPVNNKISEKVMKQYEENPYPRWVNTNLFSQAGSMINIAKELELRIDFSKIDNDQFPSVLIAGCGTGQHPIMTAASLPSSSVVAIDLSFSSLAYAKRKAEEYGIKNLKFIQGDILDLKELNKKFDIIESVGVLHHMDDPLKGWKTLKSCLKTGGLMKIGLYSELARGQIVEVRNEIEKLKIGTDSKSMKLFRDSLVRSHAEHYNIIKQSNDFYSVSDLRDLLFHVKEHRFSLVKLQKYLNDLHLKFCGFDILRSKHDFKKEYTESDSIYDLDKWHSFEKKYPFTFSKMYQFWCQSI